MMTPSPLSPDDLRFLDEAAQYLEFPRFLMTVANLVGKPAEVVLNRLPAKANTLISDATQWALTKALRAAVYSLSAHDWRLVGRWLRLAGPRSHAALGAAAGAAGGAFGLPGAAVEMPFTTTLMLRSIAEIAEQCGSDLNEPETLMQCLAVFSYGSPTRTARPDDKTDETDPLGAMESSYFTMRLAMAQEVQLRRSLSPNTVQRKLRKH